MQDLLVNTLGGALTGICGGSGLERRRGASFLQPDRGTAFTKNNRKYLAR